MDMRLFFQFIKIFIFLVVSLNDTLSVLSHPLTMTARRYAKQFMQLPERECHAPQSSPLVTTETALAQENMYISCRMQKMVQPTIENLLDKNINEKSIPRVCLMGSGGGARAAIVTAGSIIGLHEAGLLNACSYFCGLSGSTWAAALWYSLAQNPADLEEIMRNRFVSQDQLLSRVNFKKVAEQLCSAFIQEQAVTLSTLWGYIIYDMLFGQTTKAPNQFKDLLPCVTPGTYPYPIFTASLCNDGYKNSSFECFEFCPDKAGSRYLTTWIDSAYLGAKFDAGIFQQGALPLDMASVLGVVSCAYAVNKQDLKNHLPEIKAGIEEYLATKFVQNSLAYRMAQLVGEFICYKIEQDIDREHATTRLSAPYIPNFAYNLPQVPLPVRTESELCIVDQGISGQNIPFEPMIDRAVEVYFIFNASNKQDVSYLKKAEAYAQKVGQPFPQIDGNKILKKIHKNEIALIYDKDNSKTPILVYVPNIRENNRFSTTKFTYDQAEFDELLFHFKNDVTKNRNVFRKAIQLALERSC